MLGESLHLASECLTQEAKVTSLTSRMEALEKENSTLKKDLIESMDEAATLKEKVKVLNSDLRTSAKSREGRPASGGKGEVEDDRC